MLTTLPTLLRASKATNQARRDLLLRLHVAGGEIAAALQRLPDAASYHADEIQQWSTTPSLGGVMLTFKRHTHKRGKSGLTFWVAIRAERLADGRT